MSLLVYSIKGDVTVHLSDLPTAGHFEGEAQLINTGKGLAPGMGLFKILNGILTIDGNMIPCQDIHISYFIQHARICPIYDWAPPRNSRQRFQLIKFIWPN